LLELTHRRCVGGLTHQKDEQTVPALPDVGQRVDVSELATLVAISNESLDYVELQNGLLELDIHGRRKVC